MINNNNNNNNNKINQEIIEVQMNYPQQFDRFVFVLMNQLLDDP